MNNIVEEQVKKILAKQSSYVLDTEKLRSDTSLYGKGLGLNSLDVVSLIVRLEEEFEIFFEAEEVTTSVENFGSLLRAVQHKLRQNGSST